MIPLTDYAGLWAAMAIEAHRLDEATQQATAIIAHQPRYEAVAAQTWTPWWWIGCIHMREASGRWGCHLHNGDPLTARTVHVPRNRPPPLSPDT